MNLLLGLEGGGVQPWMRIPYIRIKIGHLLMHSERDAHAIIFADNWRCKIVYPKVIHCLRTFCEERNVDFGPFERFCQATHDPWANLLFTPLDDPQLVLTGKALASFIAPSSEALASSTSVIHSRLNVRFEGIMVRELTKLLLNVRPTSSDSVHSRSSIISMTAPHAGQPTSTSTVGYSTSDITSQVFSESGDAPPVNISRESSSLAPGLGNVFAETISVSGSDDAEEEIHFSYGSATLQPPSLCGFPGDALLSPMSRHHFGFTTDFLRDAGAHFKTRVFKIWSSSPHLSFMTRDVRPNATLPTHTTVHTDGEPPLSPIPEVSAMLESPSGISDGVTSLCHSSRSVPSAALVPEIPPLLEAPSTIRSGVAALGALSSTPRLDDVFAKPHSFDLDDGEGTVMFDFEPASDPKGYPTLPNVSDVTVNAKGYPTMLHKFDATVRYELMDDGDCVPTPADDSTSHIVAVEMSPPVTSLMSHVALLGCRDLTHPLILHTPAVHAHVAYTFVIRDQCIHFDPGCALLLPTTTSFLEASDSAPSVTLALSCVASAFSSSAPVLGPKQVHAILGDPMSVPSAGDSGTAASGADFLVCPLEDLHPSSGDEQTDVGGAVPSGDSNSDLLLPFASLSGSSPRTLVADWILVLLNAMKASFDDHVGCVGSDPWFLMALLHCIVCLLAMFGEGMTPNCHSLIYASVSPIFDVGMSVTKHVLQPVITSLPLHHASPWPPYFAFIDTMRLQLIGLAASNLMAFVSVSASYMMAFIAAYLSFVLTVGLHSLGDDVCNLAHLFCLAMVSSTTHAPFVQYLLDSLLCFTEGLEEGLIVHSWGGKCLAPRNDLLHFVEVSLSIAQSQGEKCLILRRDLLLFVKAFSSPWHTCLSWQRQYCSDLGRASTQTRGGQCYLGLLVTSFCLAVQHILESLGSPIIY